MVLLHSFLEVLNDITRKKEQLSFAYSSTTKPLVKEMVHRRTAVSSSAAADAHISKRGTTKRLAENASFYVLCLLSPLKILICAQWICL